MDVIDLTAEDEEIGVEEVRKVDNGNERKRRLRAKRQETLFQQFRARASGMGAAAREQYISAARRALRTKRSLSELRDGLETNENTDLKFKTQLQFALSGEISVVQEMIDRMLEASDPREAAQLAQRAERLAVGARGYVDARLRQSALSRLQQESSSQQDMELLNDRQFVEARERSFVTNSATGINRYTPGLTPPTANLLAAARNLQNPLGTLPHGGSLAPPPKEADFEHLVDLAVNDAQPLRIPKELDVVELPHQQQGLGWLVRAERGRNKGSILADDMGLGKTVQTIALMYANPPKPDVPHARTLNLIVCSVALVDTWVRELENRVKPEFRKRIYVHHRQLCKTKYTTSAAEICRRYDVVVCTYGAVVAEVAQRQQEGSAQTPLLDIYWHRVVLDEAHTIRNLQTKVSTAVTKLRAEYRLALTGTPMQNSLADLYPLVRFLQIVPYSDYQTFRRIMPSMTSAAQNTTMASQRSMVALLRAIMLRRRKDTLVNGRRIIDSVPEKVVLEENIEMPPEEREGYSLFEQRVHTQIRKLAVGENFTTNNMLVFLLRLRQRACHPDLSKITTELKSAKAGMTPVNRAKARAAVQLLRMVDSGDKLREFASMETCVCDECGGLITERGAVLAACLHFLCEECASKAEETLSLGDDAVCIACGRANRMLVSSEAFLTAAKLAANRGMNPSADEVVKEMAVGAQERVGKLRAERAQADRELQAELAEMDEHTAEDHTAEDQAEEEQRPTSDIFVHDSDIDAAFNAFEAEYNTADAAADTADTADTADAYTADTTTDAATADTATADAATADADAAATAATTAVATAAATTEANFANSDDDSDIEVCEVSQANTLQTDSNLQTETETEPNAITTDALTDALPTDAPDASIEESDGECIGALTPRVSIDKVAQASRIHLPSWTSSAKVSRCVKLLNRILTEDPSAKVIVFSSFAVLLDLIAIPLRAANVEYEMYTGEVGASERTRVLERFQFGDAKVLLASLQAGNVGLTLTQANHVILMEPFWNPYAEDQAQDRVHRIGQSRKVFVYRLLVKNTVEDRIMALQEKKRAAIESMLENGTGKRAARLSRNDMLYALGLRGQPLGN